MHERVPVSSPMLRSLRGTARIAGMRPSLVFPPAQAGTYKCVRVVECHRGLLVTADMEVIFVKFELHHAPNGDEDAYQGIMGKCLSREGTPLPKMDVPDVTEDQQSSTECTKHRIEREQQLVGRHRGGTPRCCLGSSAGAAFPTGAVTSAEAALPPRCLPSVRELRMRLPGLRSSRSWGRKPARRIRRHLPWAPTAGSCSSYTRLSSPSES
ncbi:uncharacterized protein LOC144122844 [Amblyomma americanum]